ncbi:MAG: hypothetical protein LBC56_01910 [Oscillospiraceae bacterium]|jgi:hypothetical protein|nr:hypothetical protein [Oscillospiraceae bacterium]
MEQANRRRKRAARVGFRRRLNPWHYGMSKKERAAASARTALRWLVFSVCAYVYWLALLLLLSLFLLNIVHVKIERLLLLSLALTVVASAVCACMLIHRKLFY